MPTTCNDREKYQMHCQFDNSLAGKIRHSLSLSLSLRKSSNNIDSVRQLDVKMDKGCSINGNNEEKANAATVNGTQTPRMSAICIRPCFGQFDLIM